MPEIREEVMIFFLAVLAGMIVRFAYRVLHCLRKIVRHSLFVIEAEDVLFWIGTAIYLFVQIYHTSDGSVRWYFVLGVVLGVIISSVFIAQIEKMKKKISILRKNKSREKLAEQNKKSYDVI